MNLKRLVVLACLVAICGVALADGEAPVRRLSNETAEQKTERLSWWTHDRFGMFIHFGLYALPARGEWIKELETIPEDRYDVYFNRFNPYRLDMRAWAKAAKAAGMKYAVQTANDTEKRVSKLPQVKHAGNVP